MKDSDMQRHIPKYSALRGVEAQLQTEDLSNTRISLTVSFFYCSISALSKYGIDTVFTMFMLIVLRTALLKVG